MDNRNIILMIVLVAIGLMIFKFPIQPQVVITNGCSSGVNPLVTVVDCAGDLTITYGEDVCFNITHTEPPGPPDEGWAWWGYAINEELDLAWESVPLNTRRCDENNIYRDGTHGRFADKIQQLLPGQHKIVFSGQAYEGDNVPKCVTHEAICTTSLMSFNVQPEPCVFGAGQGLATQTFGPGANITKSSLSGNFVKFCSQFPPFLLDSFTFTGSQDYGILERLRNDELVIVPEDQILKLHWVIENPLANCKKGEGYNFNVERCTKLIDITFCAKGNLIALPGGGFACLIQTISQCKEDSDCQQPCPGMEAKCVDNKCAYSGQCKPQFFKEIEDCTSIGRACPLGFECIESGTEKGLCKSNITIKEQLPKQPAPEKKPNYLIYASVILVIIIIYLIVKGRRK